MICTHCSTGDEQRTIFCSNCGKELEPGSLKTIRVDSFTGVASLKPSIAKFWETGDFDDV